MNLLLKLEIIAHLVMIFTNSLNHMIKILNVLRLKLMIILSPLPKMMLTLRIHLTSKELNSCKRKESIQSPKIKMIPTGKIL